MSSSARTAKTPHEYPPLALAGGPLNFLSITSESFTISRPLNVGWQSRAMTEGLILCP